MNPNAAENNSNLPVQTVNIATAFPAAPDINPKELFEMLKRRKGTILLCIAIITCLVALALAMMTSRYTAETQLMIDGSKGNLIGLQSIVSGLPGDSEAIISEIEVIRSRGLIEKVVQKLQLDQNPQFNPELKPKGMIKKLFSPDGAFGFLSPAPDQALSEAEKADRQRILVIDNFLENLEVTPVPGSRIIQLAFTASDSKLSAKIINTLADSYILEQLEVKFEATQRVNSWLNERVAGLRGKVESSELEVESYRKASGLLQGTDGTLYAQQVSQLSSQLITAKAALTEARARLSQTKRAARSGGGIESATEVLSSGLIQRLKEQEVDLDRKQAELSAEYGSKHPRMLNLLAEQSKLKSRIKSEISKVTQGLSNEVNIASVKVGSLQANLNVLKKEVASSNEGEVKLRALEREAEANRMLLETFLTRFKETSSQENKEDQQADARVISPASMPLEASFPKKAPILALAALGSAFLGIILVLFKESFDQSYRSSEQIEQSTSIETLALVPKLSGWRSKGLKLMEYIHENRSSALAESLRNLLTAIQLGSRGKKPKILLVTSANPSEGKSTISAGMALVQTLAHRKTIVVDTDLRRSTLGTVFDLSVEDQKKPGLAGYLSGQGDKAPTIREIICHDKATNTAVIPAGRCRINENPSDLINSERMDQLIEALLDQASGYGYEQIIFDTAPVMASFDAHVLATKADMTIFVIRWGVTKQKTVQAELKKLARLSPRLATVLSMVDVKSHAKYGYGDSGLYHGKLKQYYSQENS